MMFFFSLCLILSLFWSFQHLYSSVLLSNTENSNKYVNNNNNNENNNEKDPPRPESPSKSHVSVEGDDYPEELNLESSSSSSSSIGSPSGFSSKEEIVFNEEEMKFERKPTPLGYVYDGKLLCAQIRFSAACI
jgi:hypothetical protein